MMVTFISQCEKNALKKTRRVLDAFANRIGDNTWQTVITEEGLKTVKKMLRQTASKSTAISCHWIRSRSRSQFLWVVGNKSKFDGQGYVPVNSTEKNLTQFESNWHFLPLIKALVGLSALFHDWGKATKLFQQKLKKMSNLGDPLRHEWVSCLLLGVFVNSFENTKDDKPWLQALAEGQLDENRIKKRMTSQNTIAFFKLPPVAQLLVWLIMSHHRLPLDLEDWRGEPAYDIETILKCVKQSWGYENRQDEREYHKRLNDCFQFSNGLLVNSKQWLKQVKKWAKRMLDYLALAEKSLKDGSYRLILQHSRLCLMLGDHYYSSLDADKSWQDTTGLYANTDKRSKSYKQKLDEHVVGVAKNALHTAHFLPRFEQEPPAADGVVSLKKNSPKEYAWQNKAVEKIKMWGEWQGKEQCGFFAVNMASTGCGKTFANAKVMRILSADGDSLRYILALGLRTLTLQTGDEYRDRIGLDSSELAVLIGSKAIMELHNSSGGAPDPEGNDDRAGESLEPLLDEEVDYDCDIPEEGLATVLKRQRDRQFLYAPVLACTIDHIIAATETRRGGRYILPSLRLMSSDLVIDEVDDFNGSDLIAIGRLIHFAGMMGRKVMISSATIPPALAEGFFNAYSSGWKLYGRARDVSVKVGCAWIDEFNTSVTDITEIESRKANEEYHGHHQKFIAKRVGKLKQQPARRKAQIVNCETVLNSGQLESEETKQRLYAAKIQEAIIEKHKYHHNEDDKTGILVSFGVVRLANIIPCVRISKYLMECTWPEDVDVKIMAYHSQQVLLLRHEQEAHLDSVLKRKGSPHRQPEAFDNPIIRNHLDQSPAKNMLFVLVATPVEEVGRDHDFDWAVVEPSSYRSIIQLAGRVRRHRQGETDSSNIALLQYNWKAIEAGNLRGGKYFCRPGYEEKLVLDSHNLNEIIDTKIIAQRIDAVPRIQQADELNYRTSLVDLEHWVIKGQLANYGGVGPDTLQGYLTGCWFLTALPQAINPFRKSEPTTNVFLMYDSEEEGCVFIEKDEKGSPVKQENILQICRHDISSEQVKNAWMMRDYGKLLKKYADHQDCSRRQISLKYGELSFVHREGQEYEYSDQFGLVKKLRR